LKLGSVVAVPRKAEMSGPQGAFVWLVGADSKVAMRPVHFGRSVGNDVIVTDGLAAGDRYVVEGVLKVQPGIAVNAVSVDPGARAAESETRAASAPQEKEAA
jgi:membrane fusion protein (multidrug efflux system)